MKYLGACQIIRYLKIVAALIFLMFINLNAFGMTQVVIPLVELSLNSTIVLADEEVDKIKDSTPDYLDVGGIKIKSVYVDGGRLRFDGSGIPSGKKINITFHYKKNNASYSTYLGEFEIISKADNEHPSTVLIVSDNELSSQDIFISYIREYIENLTFKTNSSGTIINISAILDNFRKNVGEVKFEIAPALRYSNGKLVGEGEVCGRYLYQVGANGQKYLSNYIKFAQLLSGIDSTPINVAPTTVIYPATAISNSVGLPTSDIDMQVFNAASWQSINLFKDGQRIFDSISGKGSTVYVLDTFQDGKDNFSNNNRKIVYSLNGQIKTEVSKMIGHGAIIERIIRDIAPSAKVVSKAVCSVNSCRLDKILDEMCKMQLEASYQKISHSGKRESFILNLSIGTPDSNDMLAGALRDLSSKGIAIVNAYGNNEVCERQGIVPPNRCPWYPADWNDTGISPFYTVASWPANPLFRDMLYTRGDIFTFNGVRRSYKVIRTPTVYAPGEFFYAIYGGKKTLYLGTSFAAPVVAGALARWRECNPGEWPKQSDLYPTASSNLVIDLNYLLTQADCEDSN